MSRKMRYTISLFMSVCFLFSSFFSYAADVKGASNSGELSEQTDHWAYPVMNKWFKEGLLKGNEKGQYLPDAPISRAEFVTFVNRVFKFTQKSEHSFKDVAASDWYADDIAKIYRAGIIQGVSKSKFEPKKNISREDAAVIIGRAFKLMSSGQKTDSFKDEDSIASYALEAVKALHNKGFAKGRGDQKFSPKSNISRAEVIQLLDNVMGTLIQKAGTYSNDIPGNLVINTEGVVLKNLVIHGDLYITQGAGQGTINLDGVTVLGRTFVWGGSGISISNSDLQGTLTVDKWDSNILITTSGSQIADTKWISGGKIEEENSNATPTPEPTTSTPSPTPEPTDDLVIVKDGSPVAAVVISRGADQQTRTAAEDLIKYVKKSTGAQLKLLVDDSKADKVTVENGIIQVTHYEEPLSIPTTADYSIRILINGILTNAVIHPSSVEWDAATKTATLTVPVVAASTVEQSIQYQLSYQGGDKIASDTIIIAADPQAPVNRNGSFEFGYSGLDDATPWKYIGNQADGAQLLRSNEQARSGSYSLKVIGAPAAWPLQELRLTEYGNYEYMGYFYTPAGSTTSGTIKLMLEIYDENNQLIDKKLSVTQAATASNGEWTELKWEGEIPAVINGQQVHRINMGLELLGFAPGETIYIDDVQLSMKNTQSITSNGNLLTESEDDQEPTKGTQPLASDESEIETAQTLIYVGKKGLSMQEQFELLQDLDDDGFVIHQNGNQITIAGPTSWGTEFGVTEFLERYVGVLWLMPGEDWEDVPHHTSIIVPAGNDIVQAPAFFSRTFESTGNVVREEWKRRNRVHWRVDFGHNLFNLLPTWKYKDTNSDFYPEGADISSDHSWQPCFNAPGIVDESIANIIKFFDDNPEATSYSIGINDTRNFCAADLEGQPGKLNSIGMVDYSDIYFKWVKEVSEGVFDKHPDKMLGAYAYYNVYDAPSNIKLDPRVVIYITDDRMSWADEQLRQEGQTLTQEWLSTGATIAFYEYLFGTPYVLPRTYFNLMADNYLYAAESGINAYYSELYPNFGEGPKAWLSTKLQWDPYQDTNTLLDEWYERAVGAAAAPDLKAYYEMWQNFWEKDIFDTGWYNSWKNTFPRPNFMPLFTATYLGEISPSYITESRRLLEAVLAKAETDIQIKRAQDLLTMFEYYELSYLSYPDPNEKFVDLVSEDEAMALLDNAVQKIMRMESRFEWVKLLEHNDLYFHPYPEVLNWGAVPNEQLRAIALWISEHPEGITRLKVDELVAEQDSPARLKEFINNLIAATYGTGIRNPGFEDGMLGWHDWPDTVAEFTNDAHSGSWALRVNNSSREQTVFIEGGKTYQLSFYAKVTGSQTETNLLGINFWDVPGVGLKGFLVTVDSDEYKRYDVRFTAPTNFSHSTIVVYKNPGTGWVYADDFTIREWKPEDEVQLTGITANNGVIHALMDRETVTAPIATDFDVTAVVDGVPTFSVHPTAVTWDAAAKTAALTVPAVAASTTGQTIKYHLTYQGGTVFESGTISIAADPQAPSSRNGSFEFGYAVPDGDDVALDWKIVLNGDGIRELSKKWARSGSYSLKASGLPGAYPVQEVNLTGNGLYSYSAYFLRPSSVTTSGKIRMFIYLLNANGQTIDTIHGNEVDASTSSDTWTELKWEVEIPREVNGQQVVKASIGLALEFFEGNEHVFIDDVQLIKKIFAIASNGEIQVSMNGAVPSAPLAEDFNVTAVVDGVPTVNVHPTAVTWDAATKTATLTVPAIAASTVQQSIQYLLLYQGGGTIASDTIIIAADPQAPVNRNGSFEFGYSGLDDATPWKYIGNQADGAQLLRSNEQARSGSYSLKVIGASVAWPLQELRLTEYGNYEYMGYFYTPAGSTTSGTIKLMLEIYDENNQLIDKKLSVTQAATASNGEWTELKWEGEIPAVINGQQVHRINMGLELIGFAPGEIIYIDDVQLVKK